MICRLMLERDLIVVNDVYRTYTAPCEAFGNVAPDSADAKDKYTAGVQYVHVRFSEQKPGA